MSCKGAIREFLKVYTIPRENRSASVAATFKTAAAHLNQRQSSDVQTFLSAARQHKVLVERYNPASGLTQEERTQKAANRVGLTTEHAEYQQLPKEEEQS